MDFVCKPHWIHVSATLAFNDDLNTNYVMPVKQIQKTSMNQNDLQGIFIMNSPDNPQT